MKPVIAALVAQSMPRLHCHSVAMMIIRRLLYMLMIGLCLRSLSGLDRKSLQGEGDVFSTTLMLHICTLEPWVLGALLSVISRGLIASLD